MIDVPRRRFPAIEAPTRGDICYATTNRQRAVKAILGEIDLLLVIGSRNSSNSNRLVEIARSRDVAARLISWTVSWSRERGVEEIRTQDAESENVSFQAPVEPRSSRGVA